jgi:acetyl/propionyl-CoA carboxylase alpha subunit
VHYDPLLAKVITHAASREAALGAMTDAIRAFEILGLRHNLPLLSRLLSLPEVREARAYTTLIEDRLADITRPASEAHRAAAIAVAAVVALRGPVAGTGREADRRGFDPWAALGPVNW